jgi:ATP-dependent Clp protease ATP-binding subunit ClpA
VVDKFVMQLEAQLGDRGVTIELTDSARLWLAKKGYDPAMGARPLSRVIQEHVKKPLADELLFGRLTKGGAVKIGTEGDKLTFEYPTSTAPGRALETVET